jgi:hypothetical protein
VQEEVQRQNQGLDEVETGVELLREHAKRIGQELDRQNRYSHINEKSEL